MRTLLLSALVVGTATAVAQPVPGAAETVKRIYSLRPPADDEAPAIGALTRTEVETYGPDGRRHRVEWRDPDGTVTLTYVELYGATDRPFGAVYFEGTDLDPTLEAFAYRDEGARTVRRVTYSTGDGTVTGVNEFVTDADGREVERRYGVADGGAPRATDTVSYAGVNATGYVSASADGARRVEYVFRVETVDARGNWTSQTVLRDGEPRSLQTREIRYRDAAE